ncbi:MAG: BMP family ABC transporter substrate-binding protein [Anaerolineales bacterium]|nr:BMP family ABC transporter substrate-binding protein [Anaerolineales bacterium]
MWQPADCARADIVCVGLVTEFGGGVEQGLNNLVWKEIQVAKSEGWVDRVELVETIDSRDYPFNIAHFSGDGYDIIVTVGYSATEPTQAAARKNRDLLFVGVDQEYTEKQENLVAINFPVDQAGFMAGALAASVSESGVVGAVCESESVEEVFLYCEGFYNGAAFADPDIQVEVLYRSGGSRELFFNDPGWGREIALKLIDQGADVLFAVGGSTAVAALLAAAEREVLLIGADQDLYAVLPEVQPFVLSSVIKDPAPILSQVIATWVFAGELPGQQFPGMVTYAPFHQQEERISEGIRYRLVDVRTRLQEGEIQTGVSIQEIGEEEPEDTSDQEADEKEGAQETGDDQVEQDVELSD